MILLRIPLIVRYWCMCSDQGVHILDGFLWRSHLKLVSRFLLSSLACRNRFILRLINTMRRVLNKVVLLIALFYDWRTTISRLIACYLIQTLSWQVMAPWKMRLVDFIILMALIDVLRLLLLVYHRLKVLFLNHHWIYRWALGPLRGHILLFEDV